MLSAVLREYRNSLGLTQGQVAQALCIDRSTYAYYELGKSAPSLESIARLAKLFGITTDALLCHNANHAADYPIRCEDFIFFSKDEQNLLLCYRQLPADSRDEVRKCVHKNLAALQQKRGGRTGCNRDNLSNAQEDETTL